MLKWVIGDVDLYAASVLVATALGLAIFCTTWIARRRSRREIDHDFELAKMRQKDETNLKAAQIARQWDNADKKIEQGLITSHREDDRGDQ